MEEPNDTGSVILQGRSKALVKGKGIALPDFDSDLPVDGADLPLIVQLRNQQNGICCAARSSSSWVDDSRSAAQRR